MLVSVLKENTGDKLTINLLTIEMARFVILKMDRSDAENNLLISLSS